MRAGISSDTPSARIDRELFERTGYVVSPIDGSLIHYRALKSKPAARGQADSQTGGQTDNPGLSRTNDSAGSESCPTIVLCDGVGCDGYVWKYLMPALAESHQVVHWHYRGHGKTPMPYDRGRVTIADHADDLGLVLREVGVERAVIMGHSMGVQVSLETLRRHDDLVAGLILVCGAAGRPLSSMAGLRGELALAAARRLVARMPWLFNGMMRALLPTNLAYTVAARLEVDADRLDREDFMPYLRGMSRIDLGLFLDTLNAANQHSAEDMLGDIAVPTLVIGGSDDGFTSPVESERMANAIRGAELCIVDGGTHTAPLEYPKLVCDTVLDFLRRRLI